MNLLTIDKAFSSDQRFREVPAKTTRPNITILPFNLLQTDETDIHLFRNIEFDAELKSSSRYVSHKQVRCRKALRQLLPSSSHHLQHVERLNMIAQIPELGVVLVGNQQGRVGVLTMTRWEEKRLDGYRIEFILPLKSDEEKGWRPRKELMGMAVGPVQGCEESEGRESPRVGSRQPRRFRLLLVYGNHTILSYEISRPEVEADGLVV